MNTEMKKGKEEIKKDIIFNVPNSITLLRLILIFVFVYMLFTNKTKIYLFGIFAIAAITDWFDGYFARKLNQTTKFGARMDQVVDRIFTISIVASLIIFVLTNDNFNSKTIPLLFLISSREIIGTPGFFVNLIRKKDFYNVRYIGKLTTFLQGFALSAVILGINGSIFIVIPTFIVGIVSGFDYLKYSFT